MMGKVCGRSFPSQTGSILSPNPLIWAAGLLLVTGSNQHFPGQGSDFPSVQTGRKLSRIIADVHSVKSYSLTPCNLFMGKPPRTDTRERCFWALQERLYAGTPWGR